jgi:hypothetical protein
LTIFDQAASAAHAFMGWIRVFPLGTMCPRCDEILFIETKFQKNNFIPGAGSL